MVKSVYTEDLKSSAFWHVGSSPTTCTRIKNPFSNTQNYS
ncbi:hypothetical protein LAh9_108 [Aeromonas phage LAh_9]|uniref:Uncharacterized protein n=1 Tax=Aeromonas phage LAh_9 TaxID=2591033 RepID=A0A514A197_9CAUD|nr:hypothetical protein HWC32_gp109 [Aeromonas phage LAh_9]QDH47002.1 hypothetical protein LAh9_108 [Aeromonas phage LAh_9]